MTKQYRLTPDVLDIRPRTRLGESPWWDGSKLSWIDIRGQQLLQSDLDGSALTVMDLPDMPGFAIPAASGGWAVGLTDGLWACDDEGTTWHRIWSADHDPEHRMNDAKTDSHGCIWMGSMTYAEKDPTSALYHYRAGSVRTACTGIITSNGLGWSPDNRIFYYTDSIARIIWAYDYDATDDALTNRRIFAQDPEGYVPDGLSVDEDGCIWSCKWNGSRIIRYAPDGRIDAELILPVKRPTSISFVGADRSTIAVTTAFPDDFTSHGELDGRVLLIPTKSSGSLLAPAQLQSIPSRH